MPHMKKRPLFETITGWIKNPLSLYQIYYEYVLTYDEEDTSKPKIDAIQHFLCKEVDTKKKTFNVIHTVVQNKIYVTRKVYNITSKKDTRKLINILDDISKNTILGNNIASNIEESLNVMNNILAKHYNNQSDTIATLDEKSKEEYLISLFFVTLCETISFIKTPEIMSKLWQHLMIVDKYHRIRAYYGNYDIPELIELVKNERYAFPIRLSIDEPNDGRN